MGMPVGLTVRRTIGYIAGVTGEEIDISGLRARVLALGVCSLLAWSESFLRHLRGVVLTDLATPGPERGDILTYLQTHKDGAAVAGNSPVHGGTGPRSLFDLTASTAFHVRPHAIPGARP
jgi:hypothetical protein